MAARLAAVLVVGLVHAKCYASRQLLQSEGECHVSVDTPERLQRAAVSAPVGNDFRICLAGRGGCELCDMLVPASACHTQTLAHCIRVSPVCVTACVTT